ncbi:hypothetical protein Cs7R123_64000 [Catellatospora sp. TT07R-123]|uniref:hypothetical protein n=1 Tax=Catellatospora sp. TT07R-123 TaxID=2733863 RepID=UPI001B2A7BE0|nr:hypothetical protein [Catellatospora sp. TT07R-123]GHJ49058.1 hypothetical protein Cs7R123_64000 [Catellatospora sp. TT07R-123]
MPSPNERASRLGHVSTVQNAMIETAMTRWVTPAVEKGTPEAVSTRCVAVQDLPGPTRTPPAYVVAFDGSDQEIQARAQYPSIRVGFIQITGVFVNINQFLNSRVDGLVDPRRLIAARDAQTIQAALPGSNVAIQGFSGVDSWRAELYNMFSSQGTRDFSADLFSLTEALMHLYGRHGEPAKTIKLGRCPTCKDTTQTVQVKPTACTACASALYPTDVLRTHEEYNPDGSNDKILTRTMNVAERLLMLIYMGGLSRYKPQVAASGMFITDGPLAFHGPTAPLKRRMVGYWGEVCSAQEQAGCAPPLLVGVEKKGVFVDHAASIAEFIPQRHVMMLDNIYIHDKIQRSSNNDIYGHDEFYGRRFLYKTSTDQMIVLTVPRVPAGQPYEAAQPDGTNPCEDFASYPTLRSTVEQLDRLQTRLYPNAIIPVALAHSEASLPLGTGRSVLTLLAQHHLGLEQNTKGLLGQHSPFQ